MWKKPTIHHNILTEWNWMVSHPNRLQLGDNVDLGAFSYLQAEYGIIIEDDVQVGSHVSVYSKNTINNTSGTVILRKGCCIGSHSVILPGVEVGERAVVGAFSLVKENTKIPDGEVWVGVHAKKK